MLLRAAGHRSAGDDLHGLADGLQLLRARRKFCNGEKHTQCWWVLLVCLVRKKKTKKLNKIPLQILPLPASNVGWSLFVGKPGSSQDI